MKNKVIVLLLTIICILVIGCNSTQTKVIKPSDVRDEIWNPVIEYNRLILDKTNKLTLKISDKNIEYNEEAFLTNEENQKILSFYIDYNKTTNTDNERILLTNLHNLTGNYMFVKVNIGQYNKNPNKNILANLKHSLEQSKACIDRLSIYTKLAQSKALAKYIEQIRIKIQ